MNDERFLKDWLQDTTGDTPDAQASADRVLARVPDIRQRSRRWPWPLGWRRSDQDEPSTPRGRTRLMLSPVKAITAGALVLGLSAAFLVAQPSDGPGIVPGAEQPADPAPPVEVTGDYQGIQCNYGPFDEPFDVVSCRVYLDWSDPRLQGTDVATHYTTGDAGVLEVLHKVHDIVTDDGTWRMRPQIRFQYPGSPDPEAHAAYPEWWVLDGDGAYEGLSLFLSKDGLDVHGFIVSKDVLPPPPRDHRDDVAAGARQEAAPETPVEVTAEYRGMSACDDGDPPVEVLGAYEIAYYPPCEVLLDWSDPRLDGTDLFVDNSTAYDLEDGSFWTFDHKVHDIVTDDGAWRMRPELRFDVPGYPDPASPEWWVLDGEGAYEGLVALLILQGEDLRGYIASSDLLPPVPEHDPPA